MTKSTGKAKSRTYAKPTVYSPHSHSMVLSHGNALIFQRNFFLLAVKARLASRQNFSLMISKKNSRDSDFARFQRLSTTIGRFHPSRRRTPYRHGPKKRPSLLIDPDAHVVMTAVLEPTLAPKARPRLYVCPPLSRGQDAQGHLPQLTAFAHDRRPVAGAKGVTAKTYCVPDQLAVSQIR
jgi:hypothetical protein